MCFVTYFEWNTILVTENGWSIIKQKINCSVTVSGTLLFLSLSLGPKSISPSSNDIPLFYKLDKLLANEFVAIVVARRVRVTEIITKQPWKQIYIHYKLQGALDFKLLFERKKSNILSRKSNAAFGRKKT